MSQIRANRAKDPINVPQNTQNMQMHNAPSTALHTALILCLSLSIKTINDSKADIEKIVKILVVINLKLSDFNVILMYSNAKWFSPYFYKRTSDWALHF